MSALRRGTLLACLATAALLGAPAVSAQNGEEGSCVEGLSIGIDHDNNIISLSWEPSPGASFYDIHLLLDGGDNDHLATVEGAQTSFVHDPAPDGVLDYRVAADGHAGFACDAASAHLGGEDPTDPDPRCVTGLEAQALPNGDILLRWPAQERVVSFDVLRALGDATPTPYRFVPADSRELLDTDTTPGESHVYEVHANGLVDGEDCERIIVVAVPFFPSIAVAIAAGGAALGAWALLRRRA